MEIKGEAKCNLKRWGLNIQSTSGELSFLSQLNFGVGCHEFPWSNSSTVHIRVQLLGSNASALMCMGFSYFLSGSEPASFPTNNRKSHKELLVLVWASKLHHALCWLQLAQGETESMASFAVTLTNKAWDILVGASRNYTRQHISQPAPKPYPQWKIIQDVVVWTWILPLQYLIRWGRAEDHGLWL